MVRVERNPKKKGYMRLHTTLGDLNVELHCDIAPRTCENFIALAESGYYKGTVFHRSIKNFMIQVIAGLLCLADFTLSSLSIVLAAHSEAPLIIGRMCLI